MPRRSKGKGNGIEQIRLLFVLLIVIAIAASFLFSSETANSIVELFVKYLLVPSVISFFIGTMVESLSGNLLKTIAWNIKIGPLRFSITAFGLAVLLLKFILF